MENMKIYEDIAARTGGDVYVGVVGPVRTGKSTFIKRFMETLVIPGIDQNGEIHFYKEIYGDPRDPRYRIRLRKRAGEG